MFNPNRKQKIDSEPITNSKEPTATCDPQYIQTMKSTKPQSFKKQKKK